MYNVVGKVSRVIPQKRCNSAVGSIPGHRQWKFYRDLLVTAKGKLYEKILAAPSVRRIMYISAMCGAQPKKYRCYNSNFYRRQKWALNMMKIQMSTNHFGFLDYIPRDSNSGLHEKRVRATIALTPMSKNIESKIGLFLILHFRSLQPWALFLLLLYLETKLLRLKIAPFLRPERWIRLAHWLLLHMQCCIRRTCHSSWTVAIKMKDQS